MKENKMKEEFAEKSALDFNNPTKRASSLKISSDINQACIDGIYKRIDFALSSFESFGNKTKPFEITLQAFKKKTERKLLITNKGFISRRKRLINMIQSHIDQYNKLADLKNSICSEIRDLSDRLVYTKAASRDEVLDFMWNILEIDEALNKVKKPLTKVCIQHIHEINALAKNMRW